MYDAQGQRLWAAELDIYGNVRTQTGNRSLCPFRYPGQYEDLETGLHYNRFRYYDPQAGAYISQDPIGLAGGNPTLYGYVGDPNGWVDEFGLALSPITFSSSDLFSPENSSQSNSVKISMQGNRAGDFREANKAAGFKKTPAGHTWHHVADFNSQNGTCTMQLVKSTTHDANKHAGSVSQFRKISGVKYDTPESARFARTMGWNKTKQRKRKKPCGANE